MPFLAGLKFSIIHSQFSISNLMPNIYLRLPTSVCYYHRNYAPNHKLSPFDPMKFSPNTEHDAKLRGGLAIFTNCGKDEICYSQQQWKNLLLGKTPDGSKQVLKRDPSVWITYEEICTIVGLKMGKRSLNYDYLCIAMPYTILINDREVRTNPAFSLSRECATGLQILLMRDFKRALIDWEISTQDFCIQPDRIVRRGHMNTIERFLMRYDIPVSKDGTEKESLRRQLDRWLNDARVLERAYRSIDIDFIDSTDKVFQLS